MDLTVDLRSKVALVTGASGGLGESFARVLAASGARVVVAARRLEACRAVCERIAAEGGHAVPVALDVTDRPSVQGAIDETRHSGIADDDVGRAEGGRRSCGASRNAASARSTTSRVRCSSSAPTPLD